MGDGRGLSFVGDGSVAEAVPHPDKVIMTSIGVIISFLIISSTTIAPGELLLDGNPPGETLLHDLRDEARLAC